jgi:trehalose 6-phosphate phosphatase
MTRPPPTPRSALKAPAAVPITASFAIRARWDAGTAAILVRDAGSDPHSELTPSTSSSDLVELVAPLRADPAAAAILCDVDGTLAPIVERAEDAVVPARAREALRALGRTYALVACISGRRAVEARRLVGLDELAYAGNHGLELLGPGESEPTVAESVRDGGRAVQAFAREREERLTTAGLRLEDKGPIQALHWRGAADDRGAEAAAREIAAEAEAAGIATHWGRKVLELRPTAEVDKGRAVRALLDGRAVAAALYAGDDRTDLDAFRELRALEGEGRLRAAVCIGIASPEGPPELAGEADGLAEGPDAFTDLLETLAREAG